jgi:hypothetical protein
MPTYFNGYDAMKTHATGYLQNTNAAISNAATVCGTASSEYESAFTTDESTITTARSTRDGAIESAKSSYDTAIAAARDSFKSSTSTLPSSAKAKVFKAKYLLLKKVVQQQSVVGF